MVCDLVMLTLAMLWLCAVEYKDNVDRSSSSPLLSTRPHVHLGHSSSTRRLMHCPTTTTTWCTGLWPWRHIRHGQCWLAQPWHQEQCERRSGHDDTNWSSEQSLQQMDLVEGGLVDMAFERTEARQDQEEQGLSGQLDLRQQGYRRVAVVAQEPRASPPHCVTPRHVWFQWPIGARVFDL